MPKVKKKRVREKRPFLTGNPDIDYRMRWDKYPLIRTEEEQRSAEAFRAASTGHENYCKCWPRSGPRYEDEVRYEKKFKKYSNQDPADFCRYVNEWRKEQGIPEKRKDREGFLAAMERVYPGRVLPVIIR
jgi:hypothetical protein